jgi:hypothetical protein
MRAALLAVVSRFESNAHENPGIIASESRRDGWEVVAPCAKFVA